MVDASPYKWPHDGSFSPSTTALVVVDMQNDFCSEEGYLAFQGCLVANTRAVIPRITQLLDAFRRYGFPIFHTREGHRPDLSTVSSRDRFRSHNVPSGLGIGDMGPLGRLLIRGERGHDIVDELYPRPGEPIVDKPGKSAFTYTDFELLLKVRGVQNLVLCGVTTDVCVSSTMREANDRGYDCLLVTDATGAGLDELHSATVKGVQMEGGIFGAVADTADVIEAVERWTKSSGRVVQS
ncbi:Isochorismatase hydrolase [Laetiporus sulphureus 93-53]|uniref:Isochorismatase hydrolase n=1 Tax=Laetiporus sulphureus 93-53 TaxID=1314785 RepID=A0A165E9K2_9APHY|nr:Isochorismatase hydrolase [Laetiporus sulphureus 93-53]KZT06531.1 Isochorismatase hydrolase [Laetiporus sulphureus 93-53]